MSNAPHKWSNKYEYCVNCGTTETKHHSKGLCIKCAQIKYEKNRVHMCSICNKEGRISKKIDNQKICNKCYAKYYRVKRQCDLCHKIKVIAKVTDGNSICPSCYSKFYAPKKECEICYSIETVASIIDGKVVCKKCYKKSAPLRLCGECNKMGRIEYKKDGKDICSSCYNKLQRPKSFCSNCGKLGITKIKMNDVNICSSCYDKFYRPKRTCSICNKKRIIKKIIDDTFICDNCYINYAPKRICAICGIEKPIKKIIDGQDICTQCYTRLQNTCKECGQAVVSFNYSSNICDNCAYKKKIIKLIEESRSKFTSEKVIQLYENYVNTLIKYKHAGAKVYYKVINEYNFFKLIEENGYNNIEEEINELNTKIYLPLSIQNYFFMKGLLKIESDLDIFNKIHFRFINKVVTQFTHFFTSYSLNLIEIKKKLIFRGWNNKFSSKYYLQCLRQACLFFDFLCKSDIRIINELRQDILDDYVVNYCTNIFALKILIKYINRNVKLFSAIKILNLKINTNIKNSSYSQNEKEAIFQSLSNSETNVRDKIIAFLVLIYGIKISDVVNISFDDFKFSDRKYCLNVRNTWITLNDEIGKMIWSYLKNDRKDQLSLGCQKEWLFPGSKYFKPISSKYINSVLTKFGIFVRRSFPTLFKDYFLNYDMSPSVLIKGLGMNIATTINYYKYYNISGIHEIDVDKDSSSQKISNISYIVYILLCSDGTYYTGYTTNLQNRLKQHQEGTGCTYTKTRTPVELVYVEELPDKPSALKREKQIKKLTIFDKEKLIEKSRVN